MNISCVDGSGSLILADNLFDRVYSESLVHQLVSVYGAGARQGSHAQKTRAMVSGGGRKPWRQKGTGRARAGTNRSPLWRGGGQIFAKVNRDYSQKLNKKMYRAAMQSIVSQLIRDKRLDFIGSKFLELPEPRVKSFVQVMGTLLGDGLTTIVIKNIPNNLALATRNLPNIEVISVFSLDPLVLINSSKVLLEAEAAKELEKYWQ